MQPVIANFLPCRLRLPETVLLLYIDILQEWSCAQVVENPVEPRRYPQTQLADFSAQPKRVDSGGLRRFNHH